MYLGRENRAVCIALPLKEQVKQKKEQWENYPRFFSCMLLKQSFEASCSTPEALPSWILPRLLQSLEKYCCCMGRQNPLRCIWQSAQSIPLGSAQEWVKMYLYQGENLGSFLICFVSHGKHSKLCLWFALGLDTLLLSNCVVAFQTIPQCVETVQGVVRTVCPSEKGVKDNYNYTPKIDVKMEVIQAFFLHLHSGIQTTKSVKSWRSRVESSFAFHFSVQALISSCPLFTRHEMKVSSTLYVREFEVECWGLGKGLFSHCLSHCQVWTVARAGAGGGSVSPL